MAALNLSGKCRHIVPVTENMFAILPTCNADRKTVSCAIAFHREGLLAHTTLLSLAAARDYAEQRDMAVEFVITLDNADALTETLVRGHPAVRESDLVESVHYGDLGLGRNHAVKLARGEYVVVMDGDDYYSANYIYATVAEAARHPGAVVFPEYLIGFAANSFYARFVSIGMHARMYALFSAHTYTSAVTARRALFLDHPYAACPPGFAFEDWHWNYTMTAYGHEFRCAPSTVRFYRQHGGSIMAGAKGKHLLTPPGDFFGMLPAPERHARQDRRDAPEMPPQKPPMHPVHWKTAVKAIVAALLRQLPGSLGFSAYKMGKAALRFYRAAKNTLSGPTGKPWWFCSGIPDVLRDALLETAKIDGMLCPDCLPVLREHVPSFDEAPGRTFAEAWYSLPCHDYDIVYTAPHIHTGGVDRITSNYMRAAAQIGKRVLCITTNDRENRFPPLPDNITILELGKITSHLSDEHQQLIIARLLLQLAPPLIHVANDLRTFFCLEKYGRALSQGSVIVASMFCDAMDGHGVEYGAGTRFLRPLFNHVKKIVTDSSMIPQRWREKFGLPDEYFQTVHSIAPTVRKQCAKPAARDRLLWAGRFDSQKRMDIACNVAERMPDLRFDFYGCKVLDANNEWEDRLAKLPNVRLLGRYENFSDIPAEQYFAFLYTTQYDGLPNVLLEALASGLPAVAPDVGGIREIVNDDTGWLVKDNTDVEAYMAALREMQRDVEEVEKRWCRARDLLLARHTEENFREALFAAYGWL